MDSPSRALIQAASRGDADSIGALFARHLPGVHAFIRLRTGKVIRGKESYCDLVQSVCREILEDIGTYEYQTEGQFRYWLYLTAERKVISRGRYWSRAKRDPHKEEPPQASFSGDGAFTDRFAVFCSPSLDLQAREEAQRLEACFDQLDQDHREVILLARVVRLTHTEIAQQMGRSEGAVRVLLHRALARLSTLME